MREELHPPFKRLFGDGTGPPYMAMLSGYFSRETGLGGSPKVLSVYGGCRALKGRDRGSGWLLATVAEA
jgi:hypothetical protein